MTKIHQGLTPKLWSAAAGGVAVSIIGFSALGWTLSSTADRMAAQRADAAVVSVLAPICVQNFRQQSDSTAKLVEFKKASSWDQRSLVEKGGWAKMPGGETTNSAVVSVCAEKIGQLS